MTLLFHSSRLCSPQTWMATHDSVKCKLWTRLVGPCHLDIVGPSGSRTTVLSCMKTPSMYCRICCLMVLQWWDVWDKKNQKINICKYLHEHTHTNQHLYFTLISLHFLILTLFIKIFPNATPTAIAVA